MTAHEEALFIKFQRKADLFDYLCWLEDFCAFRKAALDGKAGDYLVCASDGTTCWGKTYEEAVMVAQQYDKEIFDSTKANAATPTNEPTQSPTKGSTTESAGEAYPRCTYKLREKGLPYPRTCEECGLGPCKAKLETKR